MDNATDLQSAHIGHKAAAAEGAQGRSGHMPSGLVVFIASCFLMRLYPQPFPIDIATTQALQNLLDVHWATTAFQFVGAVNDPGFAPLAVMLCFAVLFLEGLLFKEQGKSPIRWMVSATLLAGQTGQAREAWPWILRKKSAPQHLAAMSSSTGRLYGPHPSRLCQVLSR